MFHPCLWDSNSVSGFFQLETHTENIKFSKQSLVVEVDKKAYNAEQMKNINVAQHFK